MLAGSALGANAGGISNTALNWNYKIKMSRRLQRCGTIIERVIRLLLMRT
jgi:hypothetical protein